MARSPRWKAPTSRSTGARCSNSAATATPIAGRPRVIDSYQAFLNSECIWFHGWFELRTAEKQRAFREFLDNYVIEQKKHGRFPRPLNNYLYDVDGWLKRNKVVEDDNKAMLIMAFAFLAVCLVNTVGLLLAKFLNAAPVSGVRRALGASRRDIFWQHLTESGVVALAGGIVGGLLGLAGIWALRAWYGRFVEDAPKYLPFDEMNFLIVVSHRGARRPARRPVSRVAHRARGARLLPEGAITMEIRPILSALLRNRAGAILVSLQIAITLAIVVNAIYVTQQRVEKIGRPSGIDDQNIFSFSVTGFEKDFDFQGMVREDMALLRQMPGVVDAAPIQQVPLSGSGSSTGLLFTAGQERQGVAC